MGPGRRGNSSSKEDANKHENPTTNDNDDHEDDDDKEEDEVVLAPWPFPVNPSSASASSLRPGRRSSRGSTGTSTARSTTAVVSLQIPWELVEDDSHAVCYRKVVPLDKTVEEFLYDLLMDANPVSCWRSFQQLYLAHTATNENEDEVVFGIRTGPNCCFMVRQGRGDGNFNKNNQKKRKRPRKNVHHNPLLPTTPRPRIFHVCVAPAATPKVLWSATDTMVDLLRPLSDATLGAQITLVVRNLRYPEPLFLDYQQLVHIHLPSPLHLSEQEDGARKPKANPKTEGDSKAHSPRTKQPSVTNSPVAKKAAESSYAPAFTSGQQQQYNDLSSLSQNYLVQLIHNNNHEKRVYLTTRQRRKLWYRQRDEARQEAELEMAAAVAAMKKVSKSPTKTTKAKAKKASPAGKGKKEKPVVMDTSQVAKKSPRKQQQQQQPQKQQQQQQQQQQPLLQKPEPWEYVMDLSSRSPYNSDGESDRKDATTTTTTSSSSGKSAVRKQVQGHVQQPQSPQRLQLLTSPAQPSTTTSTKKTKSTRQAAVEQKMSVTEAQASKTSMEPTKQKQTTKNSKKVLGSPDAKQTTTKASKSAKEVTPNAKSKTTTKRKASQEEKEEEDRPTKKSKTTTTSDNHLTPSKKKQQEMKTQEKKHPTKVEKSIPTITQDDTSTSGDHTHPKEHAPMKLETKKDMSKPLAKKKAVKGKEENGKLPPQQVGIQQDGTHSKKKVKGVATIPPSVIQVPKNSNESNGDEHWQMAEPNDKPPVKPRFEVLTESETSSVAKKAEDNDDDDDDADDDDQNTRSSTHSSSQSSSRSLKHEAVRNKNHENANNNLAKKSPNKKQTVALSNDNGNKNKGKEANKAASNPADHHNGSSHATNKHAMISEAAPKTKLADKAPLQQGNGRANESTKEVQSSSTSNNRLDKSAVGVKTKQVSQGKSLRKGNPPDSDSARSRSGSSSDSSSSGSSTSSGSSDSSDESAVPKKAEEAPQAKSAEPALSSTADSSSSDSSSDSNSDSEDDASVDASESKAVEQANPTGNEVVENRKVANVHTIPTQPNNGSVHTTRNEESRKDVGTEIALVGSESKDAAEGKENGRNLPDDERNGLKEAVPQEDNGDESDSDSSMSSSTSTTSSSSTSSSSSGSSSSGSSSVSTNDHHTSSKSEPQSQKTPLSNRRKPLVDPSEKIVINPFKRLNNASI